jgi:hypothetical protein
MHGAIRVDAAGTRASVYFRVECAGNLEGAQRAPDETLSTLPGPTATEEEPEASYEPLAGHVRAGRLVVGLLEVGETHDEAAQSPSAEIHLRARVSARRVRGVFSLSQPPTPGLVEPSSGFGGCATGNIAFTADRR